MSLPPPWNPEHGQGGQWQGGPTEGGPRPPVQGPPPIRTGVFQPPPYQQPRPAPVPLPGGRPWPPPPPGANGGHYPLADWGQRAGARLIDTCFVIVPGAVLTFAVSMIWGAFAVADGSGLSSAWDSSMIIASVCAFLLWTGYDAFCVHRWGRTPGKTITKILVVPLSGEGRPARVPFDALLVRAGLFQLPWAFMWAPLSVQSLLGMVAMVVFYFLPLWDRPNQQGLHDKVSRTVVVRTG
ncbi:RDD family protein [Actinorugispora endophytica]|uniref:RDD family protein n=1 Tax=Actinorugispora endophytica TaxID=1605990 RepID=A0A4R6UQL8_9ACTN|nr:RDD family protein [Actinorugispora endophytica]TDQ47555.1 RDD family protein [Actinorugispora endophytica]